MGGAILPTVPKVQFFVNKYVNLFYHLCVLFAEYFSDEQSLGFLNNPSYRQAYGHLKTERLHHLFQVLQEYSFYAWDFAGKSLFEATATISAENALKGTFQKLAEIWLEIYSEALPSYEGLWAQAESKLKEYALTFEASWSSVSGSVLSKMSGIARCPWKQESITVHFVDCLHGASAWIRDVVLPPFMDIDAEKKLLAHELAHTLVPDYFLKTRIQNLGLDWAFSHTIVDFIAYFSIKDYITDPEKRGIKPNPNYYEQVDKLYPIFEDCFKHPEKYESFDDILMQIKIQTSD